MTNAFEQRCTTCGEIKSIGEFYPIANRPDHPQFGRRHKRCKSCVRASVAQWQRDNRDKVQAKTRRYMLRSVYGLNPEDYERMLEEQGGGCAICTKIPDPGIYLRVDHCHETGRVRGLLCHNCNAGIGLLQDSPTLVRAALEYLGCGEAA